MISSPALLGLNPARFPRWRTGQPEAIHAIHTAPTKYVGIVAPTGFGKSAMVMGYAQHFKGRVAILTSTKALQDQYAADFNNILLDIRGQSNYQCEIALVSVAEGPCHTGQRCELKQDGCIHFDLKRAAARERVVLTNYQMWLYSMREKVGLGEFDAVVCDEAHNIHAELSKFLSTRITGHETKHHLGGSHPDKEWAKWAENSYFHLAGRMGDIRKSGLMSETEKLKELAGIKVLRRKLSLLSKAVPDGWIMQEGGYRGEYQWECIHPGRYASKYLFQRADKFVLTSASIRPKTFQSMYIAASKVTFKEYPSSFPVSRRPVYVYPAIKYSYDSTAAELRFLIAIIDQFIDARLDRKGIIHSVSYERAELIRANSRHKKLMLGNHTGDELPRAVEKFRKAKAPCILVSPSLSEGHSFPGAECEYIIVPKVPFGNTSTDVHKARAAHDRTYGILETCIQLRQMLGRGMRSADDRCEGLILDSQFDWLHRQHRKLFPGDFNESIKHVRYLPAPPPSLVVPK